MSIPNKRTNLIQERTSRSFTQYELSEFLGITERHYQRLEAGASAGSIKLWEKLSNYFNKPIDYLLAQDIEKNSAKQFNLKKS